MDILGTLACLLFLGLFLLLLMALISPFESLSWWAGWSKRSHKKSELNKPILQHSNSVKHYIVYLTAIGGISAEDISKRERLFLAGIHEQLPNTTIIDDVFPFSVTNNPLNGERQLGWLWQKIHTRRRAGHFGLLTGLIFVRNLLQVGVSGDRRYGPISNAGVAREIARSLVRHGYVVDSGHPIAIMGWSGGGQIAIGVARYLNQALQAPVNVVSIGGVMADDPSIAYVNRLIHLQGSKDALPNLGKILYPGRWPFLPNTPWNKAERDGTIQNINPGPFRHTGKNDYFDRHATLPDGQTFLDKTVSEIATALKDMDADYLADNNI